MYTAVGELTVVTTWAVGDAIVALAGPDEDVIEAIPEDEEAKLETPAESIEDVTGATIVEVSADVEAVAKLCFAGVV